MKKIVSAAVVASFMLPMFASAAGLSAPQVSAVLGLLRAFGAGESLVASVASALGDPPASDPAPAPVATTTYTRPDVSESPYVSSTLGYDLSFSTRNYPQIPFGFVVVGVTAGKAYTHNDRAHSEYSFAQFGSAHPTLYLNLNAPYGSSATSAHMSTPRSCTALFGAATTSASAGGTYPEPTVCGSYNYGYNAAKDAYAYATGVGATASLWWLDIEDGNSWSADTAVNDAVMQGAIDYLNSVNVRVGVYSVPYMGRAIAGSGFAPTQSLKGAAVATPTWFPVGIATQVKALNACLTKSALIPGDPIWIIQYEADSTAIDQNIAC
jgi:hypothetical protein